MYDLLFSKVRRYAAILILTTSIAALAQAKGDAVWPEFAGDAGGMHFSAATEITPGNVGQLQPAWVFHTHAIDHPGTPNDRESRFEATPVLWNGLLYFDTPFGKVFAVDARTGKQRWAFDPRVDRHALIAIPASRGVVLWHDSPGGAGPCRDRVFVATVDRRLIALDARNGEVCRDFGTGGTVDLARNIYLSETWLLLYTSAPVVVGDHLVLGSSVGDNQTTNAPSGEIRAFDVRSGRQVWTWQPVRWDRAVKEHLSGGGNAWAPLAADPANDLVFLPTGSAALDYYGGTRIGDNRDADSIVALRASTGQKVWSFQLVHHNLWDYDTASQPLLFSFRGKIPAVAVTNKTGMIYVFNRLTGEPLYPIQERPVPQTDIPGEVSWPTQPFSTLPPLVPQKISVADLAGSPEARSACTALFRKFRYDGLFTPPSSNGTLLYPAALGGPNWGGSALDPRTGILYTRTSSAAYGIYLMSRNPPTFWQNTFHKLGLWSGSTAFQDQRHIGSLFKPPDMGTSVPDGSRMRGSPYQLYLQRLTAPDGTPCAPAPFGRIVATDLNSGKQLWSVAHGFMGKGLPGSIGMAGSIATAGGLLFVASTTDPAIRAYSSQNGQLLWKGELPSSANATPMTYTLHGQQFVVIAAGGHWTGAGDESDSVVAFALRKPGTTPTAHRTR